MPAPPTPKPFASLHSESGRWLTSNDDALFSPEPSESFSGTWPTSGMTRAGMAFAQPTWEQRTAGTASSSSPLPADAGCIGAEVSLAGKQPTVSVPPCDGDSGRIDLTLLPTPTVSDANGAGAHGAGGLDLRTSVSLLPTPRATRGGSSTETTRLLPTPSVADTTGGRKSRSGDRSGELLLNGIAAQQDWRQYEDVIARAEIAVGRAAAIATETGRKGTPQLSAAFVEWLMMLPAGHVTDPAIGLTRIEQLKALGNGVVPPQAAAATRAFVADLATDMQEAVAS